MRAGANWTGYWEEMWGARDLVEWAMMNGGRLASLRRDEGQDQRLTDAKASRRAHQHANGSQKKSRKQTCFGERSAAISSAECCSG